MDKYFKFATQFSCTQTYLFDWHEQAGAFQRLVPPWKSVQVVESDYQITNGSRTVFSVGIGPVKARWEAVHQGYQYPDRFIDVQNLGLLGLGSIGTCFQGIRMGVSSLMTLHTNFQREFWVSGFYLKKSKKMLSRCLDFGTKERKMICPDWQISQGNL